MAAELHGLQIQRAIFTVEQIYICVKLAHADVVDAGGIVKDGFAVIARHPAHCIPQIFPALFFVLDFKGVMGQRITNGLAHFHRCHVAFIGDPARAIVDEPRFAACHIAGLSLDDVRKEPSAAVVGSGILGIGVRVKFFDDVAVIAASFQHQRGRRGSYRNSRRAALRSGHSLYGRSRFLVLGHDIESFFQFCNCFLALCRDIVGNIALFGDFRPPVIQLHNARVVIRGLKCLECCFCVATTCTIVVRQDDNHLVGKVCDILIIPMGTIRQTDCREAIFRKRVYVFLAFNQEDCFRIFQYHPIVQGNILRFMVVVATVRLFAAPEEAFVRITDFLCNEFSVFVKVLVDGGNLS